MKNDKREQATHELKIWPEYFNALKLGLKNFEIRKNDRDFQIGDTLKLREYDDDEMIYSGDELERTVTYIAQGVFGLPDDVCVMSLATATAEADAKQGLERYADKSNWRTDRINPGISTQWHAPWAKPGCYGNLNGYDLAQQTLDALSGKE